MNVFVVGANGFIGAHAAAAAQALGADVTLIEPHGGRQRLDALGVNEPTVTLDQADLSKADVVLVLSGTSSPSLLNATDVERIGRETEVHQSLLARLLATDSRPLMVLAGSRTEYGRPDHVPVAESHPLRPRSSYAAEKVFVEQLYAFAARDSGLPSVRLRITNPYGPFEWVPARSHGLISIFAQQAVENGHITVYDQGALLRDDIHVDDVAALLTRVIETGSTGTIALNVGSGSGRSIRDVAEAVASSQPGVDVQSVPSPAGSDAIGTGDFIADIGKANRMFDWEPAVAFDTGVRTVAAHEADRIRAHMAQT